MGAKYEISRHSHIFRCIDVLVPDIPESLDIKIKRERYLAKEALQDADQILQKVLTDHESDRVDSGSNGHY